MYKKMLALKQQRASLLADARKALESGEADAHTAAMQKIEGLNTQIEQVEKFLDEERRSFGIEEAPPLSPVQKEAKVDGMTVMLKAIKGQRLSEAESGLLRKALVTGENGESGEGYLIPTDVQTTIREMRRSYQSAKDYVNVVPTDCLSGSCPVEAGTPSGLVSFDDGDEIPTGSKPNFINKPFAIKFKGALMPVSRVLSRLATSLQSYLDRWFVKNAVISENADIFNALKQGYQAGVPKAIGSLDELAKSLRKDLDPACLIGGVILTNQSGAAQMETEKDGMDRPLLQPDLTTPNGQKFKGLPIVVFSDAELPNIDETHAPVFYGNTKAGCDFIEFDGLTFSSSEHYYFGKNQDCLRVTEGYDVVSTDGGAYIYGSYALT